MSKADHLAAYAEGWSTGNSDKILSALADNYVLDDPNHGSVAKGEMAAYLDGMKATVSELRGGKEESQFLAPITRRCQPRAGFVQIFSAVPELRLSDRRGHCWK
jgi:hypothetical protein